MVADGKAIRHSAVKNTHRLVGVSPLIGLVLFMDDIAHMQYEFDVFRFSILGYPFSLLNKHLSSTGVTPLGLVVRINLSIRQNNQAKWRTI